MKRKQNPDEVKRLTKYSKREDYIEVLTYWQEQLKTAEKGTNRRIKVLNRIHQTEARLADYDKQHCDDSTQLLTHLLEKLTSLEARIEILEKRS